MHFSLVDNGEFFVDLEVDMDFFYLIFMKNKYDLKF